MMPVKKFGALRNIFLKKKGLKTKTFKCLVQGGENHPKVHGKRESEIHPQIREKHGLPFRDFTGVGIGTHCPDSTGGGKECRARVRRKQGVILVGRVPDSKKRIIRSIECIEGASVRLICG